jgi:uncharacterized surface protein with fasciclin (FAS1) repeats
VLVCSAYWALRSCENESLARPRRAARTRCALRSLESIPAPLFWAILTSPELVDALKNEGPFTFFSPGNAEVAKITPQQVSALRADKGKLCEFLQTHTAIGRYKYQDLAWHGEKNLLTLSGKTIRLTRKDGKLFVEGLEITKSDIAASNGWVHDLQGVIVK